MTRLPTRFTRFATRPSPPLTTDGFGLLELLLVVAIIAVLAAIAIPHFSSMRARGCDAQVESTVRHVATSEEAYYAGHQYYTASIADLDGLVMNDVAITIDSGSSGDLASSFRIHGVGKNALHTYAWLSDPVPGAAHLVEE
jgi:type IV pilus assembly protein PilA